MRQELIFLNHSTLGELRGQFTKLLIDSGTHQRAHTPLTDDVFETIEHVIENDPIPYLDLQLIDDPYLSFAGLNVFCVERKPRIFQLVFSSEALRSFSNRKNNFYPFRNCNRIFARWGIAHELGHVKQWLTDPEFIIGESDKLAGVTNQEEYVRIWRSLKREVDADIYAQKILSQMPMSRTDKAIYDCLSYFQMRSR